MHTQELFPLRELEIKSGVKSSTLRAWERRYGLIKPKRTPKGHRLYDQSDLDRVLRIKVLLEDGHSFINIKKLLKDDLSTNTNKASQSDIWTSTINDFKLAVSDYSYNRVDNLYNDIASIYPIELISDKLLQPIFRFYSSSSAIDPESGFFNKWLQIRLTSRFHYDNIKNKSAKKIIFISDVNKETSLMMLSNMIITLGYHALFFGNLLPYKYAHEVSKKSAARAIFVAPSKNQLQETSFIDFLKNSINPIFVFGDFDDEEYKESFALNNIYYLGHSKPIAVNIFKKHMLNIFHD